MRAFHFVPLAGTLLLGFDAPGGPRSPQAATVHEVKMAQVSETAYRFQPADVTVKLGDRIRFVNVSGGPHNVAFDAERIPDGVEGALADNMPNAMAALAGPLLTDPGATYTISFRSVKPGRYPYFCMPHVAMGMTGTITVQ